MNLYNSIKNLFVVRVNSKNGRYLASHWKRRTIIVHLNILVRHAVSSDLYFLHNPYV